MPCHTLNDYWTLYCGIMQPVTMTWKNRNRAVEVPAKRYRIGELVRYSPFSRQTIHNYTIMGLIREAEWTEGGHRLYDESVFDRLSRIIELRKTKSLTEIRRILNEEEGGASARRPGVPFHSSPAADDPTCTDAGGTAWEPPGRPAQPD
jgi:DNA-binding transcriptional MerR regulator